LIFPGGYKKQSTAKWGFTPENIYDLHFISVKLKFEFPAACCNAVEIPLIGVEA
jgi:hypothetical protein